MVIKKLYEKYWDKYFFSLITFLIFYILFSFFSYRDFPITTDEQFRYTRGAELLSHFKNSSYLQTYITPEKEPDTYYFYVALLNILNPKFYYEWFHLQNMLFAILVYVAAFFIVYLYTKNKNFSILGPVLLFFTPGFSGLIPGNPIDGPFAVLMLFNLYLIYFFRNEGFTFRKILILGFSFWLLLGLRPVGYQIFIHYLVLSLFFSDSNLRFKDRLLNEFKTLIIIFFVSSFLSVISWPYLGINYFKNLPGILFVNAKYDKWDNLILFNGEYLVKEKRPWYYLFVYIFYTLPLFVLIPFFGSLFKIKSKIKQFLLYFIIFNFVLYLLIQPVIYNGLRHFLFLIPVFCCLAAFGLWDFYHSKIDLRYKMLLILIGFSSFFWTLYQFISLYPLHYAYFNEVSGGFKKNYMKYETEYWGGAYKFGSRFVRENFAMNPNNPLKVYACSSGFSVDYYSHKKFLVTIKRQEADIIICDFPEDFRRNLRGKILKTINVDGVPFLLIRENEFKNKP